MHKRVSNNVVIIKLSTADNESVITSLVVIMVYAREEAVVVDDKDLDSNGGSGQRVTLRQNGS